MTIGSIALAHQRSCIPVAHLGGRLPKAKEFFAPNPVENGGLGYPKPPCLPQTPYQPLLTVLHSLSSSSKFFTAGSKIGQIHKAQSTQDGSPFSLATASHNTGAINYIHRYTLTAVFNIFVRSCSPNIIPTTDVSAAVLQHIRSGEHEIVAQHDPPKDSASLSSPINYPRSSTARPFTTSMRSPHLIILSQLLFLHCYLLLHISKIRDFGDFGDM